jgi:UDP-3-O-[3-hydroxymyristoyl] glucosamine N-acyltransferase
MAKTLKEIAELIGGEIVGEANTVITGVAGIQDASEGDITFLANSKYLSFLEKTKASAVITSRDTVSGAKPLIKTDNPSLAFTQVVTFILPKQKEHFQGIHKSAVISKSAKLGKNLAIGPFVVIEEGCCLGDNTVIYPNCYLGRDSSVGRDSLIYSNVSIRENCSLGDRVIVHCGTVIGSDGFGFVAVDGIHHKIPQVGNVVIEDDVEIGANVAIDRARFDKTIIGQGTKIDNLVQIGHNVRIGKNCLIVSGVAIAGSATIGNNVILAGQSGVAGHVVVGDNSVVMGKAGVTKSLAEGSIVWGMPARPADEARKAAVYAQNLPKLFDSIKEIKKKIEDWEKKNG